MNQHGEANPKQVEIAAAPVGTVEFERDTNHIVYTKHARCRMDCRQIDESEVKEIITEGKVNYDKIEETKKGKTYPLEGVTHDGQHVRIVVAPKKNELVLVTVIDLEREWACECY